MNPIPRTWGPQDRDVRNTLYELMVHSKRAWLISPYLTIGGVREFIDLVQGVRDVRLITRLNDRDILSGILDPEAIADLQDFGVKVRFHNGSLHAKLWVFDERAVTGSANLTKQALSENVELLITHEGTLASTLANDFLNIWKYLTHNTKSSSELRELAKQIKNHPVNRRFQQVASCNGLVDYGGSSGVDKSKSAGESGFWLKINGLFNERVKPESILGDDYDFQGGQTFPGPNQCPRGLKEGDLVILSRIGDKNGQTDRCIYGRGIVDMPYRQGIDEAPDWLHEALGNKKYKELQIDRWPHIVWLREVQLVKGTAGDCPWLSDVNLHQLVVGQKSHLRITEEQAIVISHALDHVFRTHMFFKIERPEGVWWNSDINDPDRYVTRSKLEAASD